MEEETREKNINRPVCPVCSAAREDLNSPGCENCGADLATMQSLEDFTHSLLLQARDDIRNRKYSDARIKLDIASSLDERMKKTSMLIAAEIDVQSHSYENAIRIFEELKKTGFNSSPWGVNLDKKISELTEIVEIEFAAKEHFNLALHRSKEGFFEEAREELYKASDLAPYLAEIYLLSAKIDLALGAQSAVFDDLTRFRQLQPDDPRGINMQRELEHRRFEFRIQSDQILFTACFVVFAIAILVVIAFVK
ncbi:MAG: hypothetical protein ABIG42_02315 [bacterium]